MTRAEVLAEYLGLTPETHPYLYRLVNGCPICRVVLCPCHGTVDTFPALALPDPLAPGHEADAWLGVLARWEGFWCLHGFVSDFGAEVFRDGFRGSFSGKENDPAPAIVRAMMAADSTFAAKMEGAMG